MTTAVGMNPAAAEHHPFFITHPGQTDVLLVVMAIFLVLFVVLIGVFYFRLHALPEQIAHAGQKIQFEIVAVLALLALFTHNHIFWIAGLLLAFVQFPDFLTPIQDMSRSLRAISGRREDQPDNPPAAAATPADHTSSDAQPISPPVEASADAPSEALAGQAATGKKSTRKV